jgi:hypothetical protein
VYNEFDQLVMSQDALPRDHNNQDWLVNKYDKFGRQVVVGIYKHVGSLSRFQPTGKPILVKGVVIPPLGAATAFIWL